MYQIPNYNIGGSGLSPEEVINRGRALISPQPQSQGLIDEETRQRIEALRQQQVSNMQTPANSREANSFLGNALQDAKDIVTGATYLATHPTSLIKMGLDEGQKISNIAKEKGGLEATKQTGKDVVDFLISNYDITTNDILDAFSGKGSKKELVNTALKAAGEHPLFTGLDIASLVLPVLKAGKAGGLASKVSKVGQLSEKEVVAGMKNLSPSQRVAATLNTSGAEVGSKANKYIDKVNTINKNYKYDDIVEAIRAHQKGIEAPNINKQLLKDIGSVIDDYDNILKSENKYAQSLSDTEKFSIADAQATQVKAIESGNNALSFQEIQRGRKPYIDTLAEKDGENYLKQLASEGDTIAQDVLNNKVQFDKGYLKITPQAGIEDIAKVGKVDDIDRVFAGRASDRVYGTATAEQIADSFFTKPDEWMNKKLNQVIETQVLGEIATKGTLGNAELVTDSTRTVKYIDPTSKSIESLVAGAVDTPTNANTVAIDSRLLNEVDKQFSNLGGSNPFAQGSGLADVWATAKSNMLTSGSYLVGNAQTGFFNAAMDTGLNPIRFAENFVNAWRTQGELSKEAGIFRRLAPIDRNIKNPVLKGALKYSGTSSVSDALNYVDTKLQNTFAEMALHNDFADRGIKYEARANALADMDKLTLAKVIDNAKTISLMNKTNTLLPRGLGKFWAMTNPYWRWADTAAQSSFYMLAKHPIASNMVLNKFMGNVAFDQEMQNRFNLNVTSDKPFVSYRYNPESKTLQEVSAEFMPIMNTVKLIGESADAIKNKDSAELINRLGLLSIPFFTESNNAIQGKDRYGRPLVNMNMDRGKMYANYRTGERYVMTPQGWKEQNMGTGGEILGTTLRSLIGSQNLINKIVAPTVATTSSLLSGKNIRYYQPYQYQLVGEFGRAGEMPEYANPRRSSGAQEALDVFSGLYARNYDPRMEAMQERPMNPRDTVGILRGIAKRNIRTQDILRRQGGGY